MSTTLPIIVGLYAFLETGLTRSRQSLVSALALFLYDYVLTISDEIEYIWNKEWSFGKLLFISNRYIPFALAIFDMIIINRGNLGDKLCQGYFQTHIFFSLLTVIIGKCILLARLHAVYARNWWISGSIITLLCSSCLVYIIISAVAEPTMAAMPPGLTSCYLAHIPHPYAYVSISTSVSEFAMCGLMVFKAWQLWGENATPPSIKLLIRDSLLYFSSLFALLLINTIFWVWGSQTLYFVPVWWLEVIPSIMGARALLNIQEHYRTETDLPLDSSSFGAFGLPSAQSEAEEPKGNVY